MRRAMRTIIIGIAISTLTACGDNGPKMEAAEAVAEDVTDNAAADEFLKEYADDIVRRENLAKKPAPITYDPKDFEQPAKQPIETVEQVDERYRRLREIDTDARIKALEARNLEADANH